MITMKNTAPPRAPRGQGLTGAAPPMPQVKFNQKEVALCASHDYYEKHRAPARVPRAGVNGGSAPDSASQIKLSHHQLGWWVGMRL